jgi:hypothetical protein
MDRGNVFAENRRLPRAEKSAISSGMKPSSQALIDLYETRMPYGKYAGVRLLDLPEPYVVWMAGEGFPAGRLGRQLAEVYEIKLNGLEYLFNPFRDNTP